jgi:hypothetical protein
MYAVRRKDSSVYRIEAVRNPWYLRILHLHIQSAHMSFEIELDEDIHVVLYPYIAYYLFVILALCSNSCRGPIDLKRADKPPEQTIAQRTSQSDQKETTQEKHYCKLLPGGIIFLHWQGQTLRTNLPAPFSSLPLPQPHLTSRRCHRTMTHIAHLPVELLLLIFNNLYDLDDLISFSRTCTIMQNLYSRHKPKLLWSIIVLDPPLHTP